MWNIDAGCRIAKDQDGFFAVKRSWGYVIGVLDGHGDTGAMQIATDTFAGMFRDESDHESFASLENAFALVAKATDACPSGTTATIALVFDSGHVVAGILGDSPVVARFDANYPVIGPIHNVGSNADECEAAIARGGVFDHPYIFPADNSWEGLQVARSFESKRHYPIISVLPECKKGFVETGGWIAVMSDGILNSLAAEYDLHVSTFIQMVDEGATAQDIANHFRAINHDDASLIICRRA